MSKTERVERPWGWYEDLGHEHHYKLKRLLIREGQRLSLQRHQHRSENWIVAEGQGELFYQGEWSEVSAGDTVHIPKGAIHRARGGKGDLLIIEVQHGTILEEDDIERLEDDFGR